MGRGLRKSEGKDRLIILDFVGNHHSFLNRPEMLLASIIDGSQGRIVTLTSIWNLLIFLQAFLKTSLISNTTG